MKPLIGREREWRELQQAWGRAAAGRPYCLVLSGEAGIGKTRLAEEFVRWAERQGYRSAAARCFASEGGLAYAPLADWLRSSSLRKEWIGLDAVWLVELAARCQRFVQNGPIYRHLKGKHRMAAAALI